MNLSLFREGGIQFLNKKGQIQMRDRFISDDLRTYQDDMVPEELFLHYGVRQGTVIKRADLETLNETEQTVLQYYTGSNGGHFVCMLDFESWGDESCPRFAYYIEDWKANNGVGYKLVRVSTDYDWKKVDDSE